MLINEHIVPEASVLSGWRKSSYSGGDAGSCVEISRTYPGAVPVRDSKDPHGPALVFRLAAFADFLSAVQRGELSVQ